MHLLCSLFCLCFPLQESKQSASPIQPVWKVGQELIYQGLVRESYPYGPGKQYRLLLHAVRLNEPAHTIAICTQLTQKDLKAPGGEISSTRIDEAILSKELNWSDPLAIPWDRIATWETGLLFGSLAQKPGDERWEVVLKDQPLLLFERLPDQFLKDSHCNVVQITQKSSDWDAPRADSTAWRITQTLFIDSSERIIQKVKRVIDQRAAARKGDSGFASVITEYELATVRMADATRLMELEATIAIHRQLRKETDKLTQHAMTSDVSASYQQLLQKLETHRSERKGFTPWSSALDSMKLLIQDGMSRKVPIVLQETPAIDASLKPGTAAPLFSLSDWQNEKTIRLSDGKGKVVLLFFYRPESSQAGNLLFNVDAMCKPFGDYLMPLGLAMAQELSIEQTLPVKVVNFPVLPGRSLKNTYQVTETPKFVIIDVQGYVSHIQVGWGPETRTQLEKEIQRQMVRVKR